MENNMEDSRVQIVTIPIHTEIDPAELLDIKENQKTFVLESFRGKTINWNKSAKNRFSPLLIHQMVEQLQLLS